MEPPRKGDAVTGGGMTSQQQMQVEVETLTQFRDKVDGLLQSLDAGKGSAKSIEAQIMGNGHLGDGFAEAAQLAARYTETHTKLQQLSQTLTETIDAMSVSIDCAKYGYQNVEATQIAELWKLHDAAAAASKPTSPQQPNSNTATNNGGQQYGM